MVVNPLSVSFVLALIVVAVVLMGVSWRRRSRRQVALAVPPVPADLGATRFSTEGLLVATTFTGRPLDRVVADGLGFRARATLAVTERGVLVDRAGGASFLIPANGEAGTASWALDRGVERDGLTVLGWSLTGADGADVPVESAFRLPPETQAAFLAALHPSLLGPDDQEAPHADE